MGRLEGKVAIVTGGNAGIGFATAKLFCQEGATVVIASRRAENNQKTIDQLSSVGEISAVQADVSKPEDCQKIIDATIEKYGRIDVLVNNAGIADRHLPITECDEDFYDRVCKIDQYSIYYMSKYALEHMEKVGKGSIVNISSIGSQGIAGISYSAAKAAVNSMTKNIAIQFAATDIRCNAVAPGPTPSEIWSEENAAQNHREFQEATGRHIDITLPLAQAEDQAEAILFFASDAAKAITGQILYVDHGTSMYGG